MALWAADGERCQDLQTLRADVALAALVGYKLPASTTMWYPLGGVSCRGSPLLRVGALAAIMDRVLHHAITINIRGHSYRLKEKLKAGLVRMDQTAVTT